LGYDQDIAKEYSRIHPYYIHRLGSNIGYQLWGTAACEKVIFVS